MLSSIFISIFCVLGLPLNLAVNGTTTVQLKSKTNFDVRNMFSTGDALVEAKIYPSGTVQVLFIFTFT